MSEPSTDSFTGAAPPRPLKVALTEVKYLAVVSIGCWVFARFVLITISMFWTPQTRVGLGGLLPQTYWVIAAIWGCYLALRHTTRNRTMKGVLCVVAIVASVAGSGSWREMRSVPRRAMRSVASDQGSQGDSRDSLLPPLVGQRSALRQKALAELGADGLQFRLDWDPLKFSLGAENVIRLCEPLVQRYPGNLALHKAYETIALAYRRLGKESESNDWFRKGIADLDAVVSKYAQEPASVLMICWYERLYGQLTDVSAEENRRALTIYEEALKRSLYAPYQDVLLAAMAKRYIDMGDLDAAGTALDRMEDFYKTQAACEQDRMVPEILRSQILYAWGQKPEAMAVLTKGNSFWHRAESDVIARIVGEDRAFHAVHSWPVRKHLYVGDRLEYPTLGSGFADAGYGYR